MTPIQINVPSSQTLKSLVDLTITEFSFLIRLHSMDCFVTHLAL